MIRNRKIKALPGKEDIPCVHCGAHGSTVLAHCRKFGGGGTGIKPDDTWGAYLCNAPKGPNHHSCHAYSDGWDAGQWLVAIRRSQAIMYEYGLWGPL